MHILSGAFMIAAVASATAFTQEQYAAAGGLATESLGAIRTVTALNAQPSIITKYRVYLFEVMRVSSKSNQIKSYARTALLPITLLPSLTISSSEEIRYINIRYYSYVAFSSLLRVRALVCVHQDVNNLRYLFYYRM
jgi:hypothetical protein